MTDPSNEELITEALHRGLDTIPDPLPPLPQWPDKLLLEAMARRLQSSASKAALLEEVAEVVAELDYLERAIDLVAPYTSHVRSGSKTVRKAATLLSALASRAQRLERIDEDEQALKVGRDAFLQAFRISGHGEWVTSPENTRRILNFALRAFAREAFKDTP